MSNDLLHFNLSKGNPSNSPVGMGLDEVVYGKSLGGEIFREHDFLGTKIVPHKLRDNTQEVFDSLNPTDIIKDQVNYRAIYISNLDIESFLLDSISVSAVSFDPFVGFPLTDVDIAVEGVYTLREVARTVPSQDNKPGNPSVVIDDEYDSTAKLPAMSWKKTLTSSDLPSDIPEQSVLKIWLRRSVVVDKLNMPDGQVFENFTISVTEYDSGDVTSLQVDYVKQEGRISLSNWFDYTITPGKGNPVVMRELLPKDIDIVDWKVHNVFTVYDKILIFYSQPIPNTIHRMYYLLVVEPNDVTELNKYVQVQLIFDRGLEEHEAYAVRALEEVKKSYYNPNEFYLFWNEEVENQDPCSFFYFGVYNRTDRIAVDSLKTYLWTGNVFVNIQSGWDNRRIESYEPLDRKVIRENVKWLNLEQFDDLFILFTQNTTNKELVEIPSVNLNRNQLLYVFEKDIKDSESYSGFQHYPGVNSEVMSQRLLPDSLPTISQITSYNNSKNYDVSALISSSSGISRDVSSNREIKHLLDGSRYIDENSVHGREFKLGNQFYTYELPNVEAGKVNSITVSTSFKIKNDDAIVDSVNDAFGTGTQLSNVHDGEVYERPWFQKNIIDENMMGSLSIPLEWIDRVYKDEWIDIISTSPTNNSVFTLQYNFARNIWKTIVLDGNNNPVEKIHNKLSGLTCTDAVGKPYHELSIVDLPHVLEPDHYQPISVQITVRNVHSSNVAVSKYMINYSVYLKGNTTPIIELVTFSSGVGNLSYIFFNPSKTLNISTNYLDVYDSSKVNTDYYISNIHKSMLSEVNYQYSKEITVNPQRFPNQADYNYFRVLSVDGIQFPDSRQNKSGDTVVPIVLYGNAYTNETGNSLNENLEVKNPIDFSKLYINDRSLRIYSENNFRSPLSFKVAYYDYDKDYAVIWVKLQDFNSNNKLYMFYGKQDISESHQEVRKSYIHLKSDLYPSGVLGAWHFDKIVEDSRLSFADGAIFEVGSPVIYERTENNELRLSRIDKEYFYGIANVYKSNYFNIDLNIPPEETLFFDEDTRSEFVSFLKETASVFKPSYTEVNEIKPTGIEILEAGNGSAGVSTNKVVSGLIALTPNDNVNAYYERIDQNKFETKTSQNGYSKGIDWVISKAVDSEVYKAGVFRVSGKLKSETITFETPFKNSDYFVFLHSPSNEKLYWNQICENRFTVTSSHLLTREISWMAFHKDMFGGVFTPDSIYVGSRNIGTGVESTAEIPSNATTWINNTYIVEPEVGLDPGDMDIDPEDPGYSILVCSNENINMYWTEKHNNRFTIKTSAPAECTLHWAVIRNGIEWWQEIV